MKRYVIRPVSFSLFICFLVVSLEAIAFAETVIVSNVNELMETVKQNAKGNLTVLLQDGTYNVPNVITITGDYVTYKSASGKKDAVTIKGKGLEGNVTNVFSIKGNHVYLENLKIGETKRHAVQIHGEEGIKNISISNVHFYDTGEQLLKGSYDKRTPNRFASNGLIKNCIFEFSRGQAFQFYTGGIDIHHGEKWVVKNNVFRNIRNPGGKLTEGAIHFWNHSQNIIVTNNKIINCDRGVMFGLDNSPLVSGQIVNNYIHVVRDTGIYLCNASQISVFNNTIYIDSAYPNAIEYRFKDSHDIVISNNLSNKSIRDRDGGTAQVFNNVTSARNSWFVSPKEGNLNLDGYIKAVHGKGIFFPNLNVSPKSNINIGADQNSTTKARRIQKVILSSSKPSIYSHGYDLARLNSEVIYEDGTKKTIDPDQLQCINKKVNGIDPANPKFSISTPGKYRFKAILGNISSNVLEIEVRDILSKQVSGIEAWHTNGQTFLTFDMVSSYFKQPAPSYGKFFQTHKKNQNGITYNLYRSEKQINSIDGLTPIASTDSFSGWNQYFYGIYTNQEKYANRKAVRYVLRKQKNPLDINKGFFVFKSNEQGPFFYAVTALIKGRENKEIRIDSNSLKVPVQERIGPGSPILQRVETPDSFQYIGNATLYFYTRWESPPNASKVNMPFDYLVAVPKNVKVPAPVGIHLHAWGGNLLGGYAWWNNAEKGAILLASNQFPYDWWTGYHENFFSDDPPKSAHEWRNGRIIPYTTNRLFSFLSYLKQNSKWQIDLSQTFIAGSSMGGSGSLMTAIRYPKQIAWARSWVGVHIPEKSPQFRSSYEKVWGNPEYQVLFEDGTPVWDYYNDAKYLYAHPKAEIGFLTFCNGKNDSQIGWEQAVEFLNALQNTRRPHLFMWGQKGHGERTVMPGNGSQRVMPLDIRVDRPLPAFTHCSLDDNPGNGDPSDGDQTGQINRWLFWEDQSIIDEPGRFEMTTALMNEAPESTCTVDITPRRVQKFHWPEGKKVFWKNIAPNKTEVQKGIVLFDRYGLITLEKVRVSKKKNRIIISDKPI
nr:alpha/beta hydrolase-fold protein [uncultured Desulfobacter sp.]